MNVQSPVQSVQPARPGPGQPSVPVVPAPGHVPQPSELAALRAEAATSDRALALLMYG